MRHLAAKGLWPWVNNRQQSNKEILDILLDEVKAHPELRFGQLLHLLGMNDIPFHEESSATLQKLKRRAGL